MTNIDVDHAGGGLEALLAGYVAGSLSEPLNVLLASHLEMSSINRGYVRALEAAAGRALEQDEVAAVPLRDRDAKLAAIFAMTPDAARPVRPRPRSHGIFPSPLAAYLGRSPNEIPWKSVIPGVKQWHVADTDDGEVTLLWIRGGQKMPTHTHEGTEVTLVLQGGFSDTSGHFVRGDVALADQEVDHRPVADDDGEDCICFAVTDAPLRLTGPFGRWVQPFLRR